MLLPSTRPLTPSEMEQFVFLDLNSIPEGKTGKIYNFPIYSTIGSTASLIIPDTRCIAYTDYLSQLAKSDTGLSTSHLLKNGTSSASQKYFDINVFSHKVLHDSSNGNGFQVYVSEIPEDDTLFLFPCILGSLGIYNNGYLTLNLDTSALAAYIPTPSYPAIHLLDHTWYSIINITPGPSITNLAGDVKQDQFSFVMKPFWDANGVLVGTKFEFSKYITSNLSNSIGPTPFNVMMWISNKASDVQP